MTKSELFKKAHAMTKVVIQCGDDYRATFSACLKLIGTVVEGVTTKNTTGGKKVIEVLVGEIEVGAKVIRYVPSAPVKRGVRGPKKIEDTGLRVTSFGKEFLVRGEKRVYAYIA